MGGTIDNFLLTKTLKGEKPLNIPILEPPDWRKKLKEVTDRRLYKGTALQEQDLKEG